MVLNSVGVYVLHTFYFVLFCSGSVLVCCALVVDVRTVILVCRCVCFVIISLLFVCDLVFRVGCLLSFVVWVYRVV